MIVTGLILPNHNTVIATNTQQIYTMRVEYVLASLLSLLISTKSVSETHE